MTQQPGPVPNPLRRAVRWAALPVRRALAPAALELGGELPALRADNARLRERVAALEEQVAVLQDGLHEARRLNLRIAELTDLVTELVLPLHDREIDPAVLERLRPDAH